MADPGRPFIIFAACFFAIVFAFLWLAGMAFDSISEKHSLAFLALCGLGIGIALNAGLMLSTFVLDRKLGWQLLAIALMLPTVSLALWMLLSNSASARELVALSLAVLAPYTIQTIRLLSRVLSRRKLALP